MLNDNLEETFEKAMAILCFSSSTSGALNRLLKSYTSDASNPSSANPLIIKPSSLNSVSNGILGVLSLY